MNNSAQGREQHEPEELHTPIAAPLLLAFVALIGWGVWYYFQASATAPDAGDSRTVVVVDPDATIDGGALYAGNCASCHQASGMGLAGVFPPLKASPWVLSPDPELPIAILLHGIQGEIEVQGTTYQGVMPSFGRLSNAEIAAIVTYVRANFGNSASVATVAQVQAVRAAQTDRTVPWGGGAELRRSFPE